MKPSRRGAFGIAIALCALPVVFVASGAADAGSAMAASGSSATKLNVPPAYVANIDGNTVSVRASVRCSRRGWWSMALTGSS
jgi:hypothetical protein